MLKIITSTTINNVIVKEQFFDNQKIKEILRAVSKCPQLYLIALAQNNIEEV